MTDAPDIPPKLRDELAGLWQPEAVPAGITDALRTAARAHLRPLPCHRRRQGVLSGLGALAAGLALILWIRDPSETSDMVTALALADVNGDRVVDIIDARDLARHLGQKDPLEGRWDVNQDGTVDLADVEAAAHEAVRIDR